MSGTGTEDYIDTGWGQLLFSNGYQSWSIASKEKGLYPYYGYLIVDHVFFEYDVSATAYFYFDKPSANLPAMQGETIRTYNTNRLK